MYLLLDILDIHSVMPKAKKLTGDSCGKVFAPSDHHILNKDAKARESIQLIFSLEYFPHPCQSFSGNTSKCTCVSDMIREHHLHLDGIKMLLCNLSKEMRVDKEVDSEGCSAIAEYLHSFSPQMSMKCPMFTFMVNIGNVSNDIMLCWHSLHFMLWLS